jgi:hypothetical protein
MTETGTCGKCASEIPVEAERCPERGYEPKTENKTGQTVLMIIGFILTATVIGAIIGVPLIYFSYKARKYAKTQTPTNTEPEDTVSLKKLIDA